MTMIEAMSQDATSPAMNDGHKNALVAKLSQFAPLSHKDIGLLESLCLPEGRLRALS